MDFKHDYVGTVLSLDIDTHEIHVFVPELLPTKQNSSEILYEVPTKASDLETPEFTTTIYEKVKKANYIIAKSVYGKYTKMPAAGSKVFVRTLDNNPGVFVWSMCAINNDYDVDSRDMYSDLCSVSIGDRTISLSESDELVINLPDNFEVAKLPDDSKVKEINIIDRNDSVNKIANLEIAVNYLTEKVYSGWKDVLSTITLQYQNTAKDTENKEEFDYYKANFVSIMKSCDNLSIAETEYNRISTEMTLLASANSNYQSLYSAFTSISDTSITSYLTSEGITASSLESDYSNICDKLLARPTAEVMSGIESEIADRYSTTKSISYIYNIGGNGESYTEITKALTASVYSPYSISLSDLDNTQDEIHSVIDNSYTKLSGWIDSNNTKYSVSDTIPAVYNNVILTPLFIGFVLDVNSDSVMLINDTDATNVKLYIDGTEATTLPYKIEAGTSISTISVKQGSTTVVSYTLS